MQVPHGELLVVFDSGRIEFIDVTSGASLATVRPDGAAVNGAAVSADFEHIAIRDANDRVRILRLGLDETTDPAQIDWVARRSDVEFDGRNCGYGCCVAMQWTADGKHLVTWGDHWNHRAPVIGPQIWSPDGELEWTGPAAFDVDVHPAENRIAFVRSNEVHIGWPGMGIEVVDVPGAYGDIEFDPDGRRLAVGGTANRIGDGEGETPLRTSMEGGATLRVVDGKNGDLIFAANVVSVGAGIGLESWVHRLAWSPDGQHIGMSLGKGHNPGVVSAKDGKRVLRALCAAGQMWSTFGVGWASERLFHPGWAMQQLVPIDDPENPIPIGECWSANCVPLDGTTDVILFHDEGLARFDPVARRVVWQR
ncbi:MAG: hypothetical protein AAF726_22915 [Planctomycetota bacterium]